MCNETLPMENCLLEIHILFCNWTGDVQICMDLPRSQLVNFLSGGEEENDRNIGTPRCQDGNKREIAAVMYAAYVKYLCHGRQVI